MLQIFLFYIFVTLQAFATCMVDTCSCNTDDPLFPAILAPGDSTVDTGNNKYISTAFSLNKADHPPYGRDFPGQVPTGRLSNGKLVLDFVASVLGLKDTVPPFLDPYLSDDSLVTGVSFGSGGSGYDDLTAVSAGAISMSKQIEYLKKYFDMVRETLGEKETKKITGAALAVISAGANDFAFNFYDLPTRSVQFNISGYQDFILKRLHNFVEVFSFLISCWLESSYSY